MYNYKKYTVFYLDSLSITSIILQGPSIVEDNVPFFLFCQVSPVPKSKFGDISIEWRHNNKVVEASYYINNNIQITMQWKPNRTLISYIYIQRATVRHQGIWSCNIDFPDMIHLKELEISRMNQKSLLITVISNFIIYMLLYIYMIWKLYFTKV